MLRVPFSRKVTVKMAEVLGRLQIFGHHPRIVVARNSIPTLQGLPETVIVIYPPALQSSLTAGTPPPGLKQVSGSWQIEGYAYARDDDAGSFSVSRDDKLEHFKLLVEEALETEMLAAFSEHFIASPFVTASANTVAFTSEPDLIGFEMTWFGTWRSPVGKPDLAR